MSNMIIAGIGGQGVNKLSRIIAQLAVNHGRYCQYTVHKGGAQSLGIVYSELRFADTEITMLAAEIPAGKLDYLIALDPYEAIRHIKLANNNTQCWVDGKRPALFIERMPEFFNESTGNQSTGNNNSDDAMVYLQSLPVKLTEANYYQQALTRYQSAKMANFLAGYDCLRALGLQIDDEYQLLFKQSVKAAVL